MNQLLTNLSVLGKNAHISIPVMLGIGLSLASIWLPTKYDDKLRATEKVLFGYGILAAANSMPTSKNGGQDKDTGPKSP